MRKDLVKLVTLSRVLEEDDGELAAAGGGDEGGVFVDKAPQTPRSFEKARLGYASAPGARRSRPRSRWRSDATELEAAAVDWAWRRKAIAGERERERTIG